MCLTNILNICRSADNITPVSRFNRGGVNVRQQSIAFLFFTIGLGALNACTTPCGMREEPKGD